MLSATGQDHFHQHFDPFTPGFVHAVANDIADLKSKVSKRTCAVMLEMIQGEGGVLPLEPAFVSAVAELCRERDILLIVDEVQTGIGRCGTLYAYEQYGIHPDIVTTAKGLGRSSDWWCPVVGKGIKHLSSRRSWYNVRWQSHCLCRCICCIKAHG